MNTPTGSGKLNSLAPLLLRLGVAGILAYSGMQKLGGPAEPVEPATPAPTEAVAPANDPQDLANPQDVYDNVVGQAKGAVVAEPNGADPVILDDEGLKVDANWFTVLGIGEIAFAVALFVGLLTRFVALGGVTAVAYGAWASMPHADDVQALNFVQRIYESNSLAMLLLGAICLTLLVTGSGPLGLDRVLFRRNKPAGEFDTANA